MRLSSRGVSTFIGTHKEDIGAGLAVAAVSIPMSLGLAVAAHVSPFASLLTILIGAFVSFRWRGSDLMVSGPAVGLALVLSQGLSKVQSPGAFALATALAGGLQLALSRAGAGRISSLLPSAALRGMMAAIGLHLVLKQIPHALGFDPDFEGDLLFWERSSNTLYDLWEALHHPQLGAVFVALLGGCVLWVLERQSNAVRVLGSIFLGTLAQLCLSVFFPEYGVRHADGGVLHFVQLPALEWSSVQPQLHLPVWTEIFHLATWELGFTFFLISSLETLLCIEALDRASPEARLSNPDRALFGQGAANLVCGMVGALPASGLIIRSSVNTFAGARTGYSVLWQAFFVAVLWLCFRPMINAVPLAALAPVLIWVGYRLFDYRVLRKMWNGGLPRMLPFTAALLGVLFLDVLSGVLLASVVGIAITLWSQHRSAITVVQEDGDLLIRINKDATFINKPQLSVVLGGVAPGMNVTIDATRAVWVDPDIYDLVEGFQARARVQGIRVETRNWEGKAWKATKGFF